MRKIYNELTKEQKENGIIFSSCLSTARFEHSDDTIHELKGTESDFEIQRARLLDDSFFNASPFKFNIIRK